MTIRHLTAGIDIWSPKEKSSKSLLISILTSGVISVILLAFLSGEDNIENLVLFFVCFTVFSFIIHTLMRFINKKKQESIDNKMNKDEMNN